LFNWCLTETQPISFCVSCVSSEVDQKIDQSAMDPCSAKFDSTVAFERAGESVVVKQEKDEVSPLPKSKRFKYLDLKEDFTGGSVSRSRRYAESTVVFCECSYPDCNRTDLEKELQPCSVCSFPKLHKLCAVNWHQYVECFASKQSRKKTENSSDGTLQMGQLTRESLLRRDQEEMYLQKFMKVFIIFASLF